jgi:hydrogenase-1 operon protein HyaF
MKSFPIPVTTIGPGSQPEDEEVLNYIEMPGGMETYRPPILPEIQEIQNLTAAREILRETLDVLKSYGKNSSHINLMDLDIANLQLINQLLGEGEVSATVCIDQHVYKIQESVYAGVWRVSLFNTHEQIIKDYIEVGAIPKIIWDNGAGGLTQLEVSSDDVAGAINAPALLCEIAEQMQFIDKSHVINLTLLPFSPEDGLYMDKVLGRGDISILSRGYGNCRISLTSFSRVWWVQYFNTTDIPILNTIEIAVVPEVALAAPEDLTDSAERLSEVIEWLG